MRQDSLLNILRKSFPDLETIFHQRTILLGDLCQHSAASGTLGSHDQHQIPVPLRFLKSTLALSGL